MARLNYCNKIFVIQRQSRYITASEFNLYPLLVNTNIGHFIMILF